MKMQHVLKKSERASGDCNTSTDRAYRLACDDVYLALVSCSLIR